MSTSSPNTSNSRAVVDSVPNGSKMAADVKAIPGWLPDVGVRTAMYSATSVGVDPTPRVSPQSPLPAMQLRQLSADEMAFNADNISGLESPQRSDHVHDLAANSCPMIVGTLIVLCPGVQL